MWKNCLVDELSAKIAVVNISVRIVIINLVN